MKKLISLLSAVILVLSLASCGGADYTDEEVINAAASLIDLSYEVNEIYFGKGLPTQVVEDVPEYENGFEKETLEDYEYDVQTVKYYPVTEDCKYHSTGELTELAEAVYSESYCKILYDRAMVGFSNDVTSSVRYPMYVDDVIYGITVRADVAEKALPLTRVYDTSSIKVEEKKSDSATVSVEATDNGESAERVSLTLVKEGGKWRLDTPTY